MNNSGGVTEKGIGFSGALTLIFIVLKLVGVIDWKWVWVLSPIWISAIIVLIILVLAVIIAVWLNK